jgi:SAM-dependent methyltransferase
MALYREDLAHIHDVGFGGFARRSAPYLLGLLRRLGLRAAHVVELGCGSGITARRLIAAGHRVLGVDASAAMLRRARRAAPGARFRCGPWLSAALPACDAVIALGEVLSYQSGGHPTLAELARFFARVHGALRPGGLLLFDVAAPGRGAGPALGRVTGAGWDVLVERRLLLRQGLLERRITAFRRVGTRYRRSTELHRLRLFPPQDVRAALERAGFRVQVLRGYGALRFPPGVVGFLARKPRRPPRPARAAGA